MTTILISIIFFLFTVIPGYAGEMVSSSAGAQWAWGKGTHIGGVR